MYDQNISVSKISDSITTDVEYSLKKEKMRLFTFDTIFKNCAAALKSM